MSISGIFFAQFVSLIIRVILVTPITNNTMKASYITEEEEMAVTIMHLSNNGVDAFQIARMRSLVNKGELDAAYELIALYQ